MGRTPPGEILARWAIRWRYTVIAVTFVLVALAGSGMKNLVFDTDYRAWFGKNNPELQNFEAIQNTYTKYDSVLFVLAPRDGNIFTRENLSAAAWLTEQAWQVPYSVRVDSLTNFQHTRGRGDEILVSDLVESPSSLSGAELRMIREVALSEPSLLNRRISRQGHVAGVNVTVSAPGKRTDLEIPEIANFSRDLAGRFRRRFPDIDLYVTGIVMMNNAFPEASQRDMSNLMPMMFGIVILMLLLMTRSLSGTMGTVLVIVFTMVTTMGLMGWAGVKLTGATASTPIIVLTLAVADCVHVLMNFLHRMRAGDGKRDSLIHSMRINLQPIFITSLTTALGFLSMNFGEVPPFWHLGNLVAVGVGSAFVFSITFFPAFLAVVPVRASETTRFRAWGMELLADWIVNHHRWLLFGLTPLMLLLVVFVPRNELNDEFVKYFDESMEFRRHTDFSTDNLTGIYTVQFSLPSGESGGIANPEFLKVVEDFTRWFREQPEVVHVDSITDTLKRLNKNLHADEPDWHRLPESRALAAQYLLLYEMSLPYGLDLNDRIDVDKSATRFVATTKNLSTRETLDLEQRARHWLQNKGLEPMKIARGSSPNIMFAHISQRNVRSMLAGLSVALLAISLILIVVLRSIRIGLVSMIPNMLPAAVTLGLWGLLVGRVGLASSVVAAISLGIIVDDTVHFLSKYQRARREQGLAPAAAIRYAFSTVGMALLVTSVVLVAGFLVLAQSSFGINATLGLLTAITITIALFTDFFLLPPLLMAVDRDKGAD